MSTSLTITLSDEDLSHLQDLADIAGTSVSDYAQSRLLSEMRADEQVLCLLGDELAVAARKAYEAMDGYTADRIAASSESPQAQKA